MITDNMIDQLGLIDTQIKELESTARKLKAELIARGVGKYDGMEFTAEVQHYDRATISPILVKEFGTSDFVAQVTQVKAVDAVVVRRVAV
jgi:hypothetical protein